MAIRRFVFVQRVIVLSIPMEFINNYIWLSFIMNVYSQCNTDCCSLVVCKICECSCIAGRFIFCTVVNCVVEPCRLFNCWVWNSIFPTCIFCSSKEWNFMSNSRRWTGFFWRVWFNVSLSCRSFKVFIIIICTICKVSCICRTCQSSCCYFVSICIWAIYIIAIPELTVTTYHFWNNPCFSFNSSKSLMAGY